MPYDQAFDDDIDLREILQHLWDLKIVIISITLAAALIAFTLSTWFLPRNYIAATYVFIGQSFVEIPDDLIQLISFTLPDIKNVAKIAIGPALLKDVLSDNRLSELTNVGKISVGSFAEMVNATDIGKDQILLQVTDIDPERAALLANIWASILSNKINSTYGLDPIIQNLDEQVLKSQSDYEKSQRELEVAISNSQIDALKARRDRLITDLANTHNNIGRTSRGLDDLKLIGKSLSENSEDSNIAISDALAITTIRQISLTIEGELIRTNIGIRNSESTEMQPLSSLNLSMQSTENGALTILLDSSSLSGITTSKALAYITSLEAVLNTQLIQLQSYQKNLELDIPQIQSDTEQAQSELDQISSKRDQAKSLLDTMKQSQNWFQTKIFTDAKIAQISQVATKPGTPISPRPILNTFAAAAIGFFLSILGVLLYKWWNKDITIRSNKVEGKP